VSNQVRIASFTEGQEESHEAVFSYLWIVVLIAENKPNEAPPNFG